MKPKRVDFIIIGIILLLALGLFAGYRILNSGSSDMLLITVGGQEYARVELSKDGVYLIRDGELLRELDKAHVPSDITDKKYNILTVRNHSASMVEAGCPDLLCVHQADIHLNGEQIVCLPNKVVVRVISKNDAPVDVVTN